MTARRPRGSVFLASWVVPVAPPAIRLTSLLSLTLLLVVVLGQTFRRGPVTFHRILGGIAAYLLLGVIWAEAFGLVELLRPGAFSGPVNVTGGPRAWLYFSFMTLTTVGLRGHPPRPPGRTVARHARGGHGAALRCHTAGPPRLARVGVRARNRRRPGSGRSLSARSLPASPRRASIGLHSGIFKRGSTWA